MFTRIAALLIVLLAAVVPTSASADTLGPLGPLQPIDPNPIQPIYLCFNPFTDVHTTDPFYDPVRFLSCRGAISGYADGTFRPYYNLTRAQWVKWVTTALKTPVKLPLPGGYSFADVPPGAPWFSSVETAYATGMISGYNCGGPGEPCDAQSRPYFRPYTDITRAQAIKILVIGKAWPLLDPLQPTFADVRRGDAWYRYIETAAARGLVSGYSCGLPGEPCDAEARPYFRPYIDAPREQGAIILYRAL